MPLAPSIMLKRKVVVFSVLLLITFHLNKIAAQDNSPYSRYGLGNVVPNSNMVTRGMGGITAADTNFLAVNFNNPASYAYFQSVLDPRTREVVSGRVILDVGVNVESRTLRNPNQAEKFTSSNAQFSYIAVGLPLKKGWGLSFGLRPLTRISYNIIERSRLPFDSISTEYKGDGGSFLPTIGTGFKIGDLSIGANLGYIFGKKESIRNRFIPNDTLVYYPSKHSTRASFGDLFINLGAMYKFQLTPQTSMNLGVAGNLKQTIKGSQDMTVETFGRDLASGDITIDTVYHNTGIEGEVIYPASYTFGFVINHQKDRGDGWLIGADFITQQWDDFRFFGATDAVQNNWQIRVGTQLRPVPRRSYMSNVAYRAGFYTGPDYINASGDMSQWGVTFGLGLPIINYNRLSANQFSMVNLGFEYGKRGNNDNVLKENLFRFSVGLNFSDLWFGKRKYD